MPSKPFIKYVGGKRQLMPSLLEHVPEKIGVYFEPFIGGGALFWELANQKRFEHAVISDMNLRLVRTYTAVRDNVEDVIALLKTYKYEKEFFLQMRARDVEATCVKNFEVAAWFIYLNRTCFNGLYRVNKDNRFNVPFGAYKDPLICDEDNLRACSAALQSVAIVHGDFEQTVSARWRSKPRCFAYFDPPYVPLDATSNFTSYTSEGFGDAEQVRLAKFAATLRRSGGVLLSNSSAERAREIYSGFDIMEVSARRGVNSKASARGAIKELLIK